MPKATNRQIAHYDEIQRQEQHIRRLEYAEEVAKRTYHSKKKDRELAQASLHELIMRDPDDLELPGNSPDPERRPANWRETAISIAIHDDAIVKALLGDEIETLGQLQSYLEQNDHGLTKIAGIDERAEAKALEQLQLFWNAHPDLRKEE